MTLEQLIQKKIASLEDIPDEFIDVVNKQNDRLFNAVLKLLDGLEKDGDLIVVSAKNASIVEQVNELLKKSLFESAYLKGLIKYVSSFSDQAEMINGIFSEQFEFVEKEIYKNLLKSSQKATLEFLDEDAIGKAVFEPLQKNLLTNIYSGGKYSDMVKSLKEYILGNDELDPKLTSYVKRYARDSMAIFDNTYTQLIAQDVVVELWEFSGGSVKDSRCWCLARKGNVYTTEEIKSWGRGENNGSCGNDWQGKNPATDENTIFAYRGGFNCIDSFIPRDPNFVDKELVNTYNSV